MKRLAGFSTLALMISATSGCGWLWGENGYFRDRGSDYLNARMTAPMEVPEQYQDNMRRLDPLLPIPSNVASLPPSDKHFDVPRPLPLAASAEVREFSLQNSGANRWLIAQRSPAEVWPLVRQFLSDSGFAVAEERPQVGEFITDWQPASQLQGDLAKRLDNALAGQENRLRIRIEPGVQRNTSEVFVVSAQRPAGSNADVPFSAASSAAVNTAVLDALLASTERNSSSVSLTAERDFDAPTRVELSTDGSGVPLLLLQIDYDRAWASVGRALEQSDLRVEDVDRSQGLYFVNLSETAVVPEEKRGFFSRVFGSDADKETVEARAERYRVRLSSVGRGVQVTVEEDVNTVASADVAQRVLGQLHNRLK